MRGGAAGTCRWRSPSKSNAFTTSSSRIAPLFPAPGLPSRASETNYYYTITIEFLFNTLLVKTTWGMTN